mmetsp:Transcript_71113/g.197531  ORF Transcript_71113/g.197531 Transcript_71113/m.197531 type:complete len:213 (+) Transcript_71113:919-1557(+)
MRYIMPKLYCAPARPASAALVNHSAASDALRSMPSPSRYIRPSRNCDSKSPDSAPSWSVRNSSASSATRSLTRLGAAATASRNEPWPPPMAERRPAGVRTPRPAEVAGVPGRTPHARSSLPVQDAAAGPSARKIPAALVSASLAPTRMVTSDAAARKAKLATRRRTRCARAASPGAPPGQAPLAGIAPPLPGAYASRPTMGRPRKERLQANA